MYYKGEKIDSQISKSSNDFHGQGERIRDELARALAIPAKKNGRSMKVLDIGTGYGHNITFLSKVLPRGRKIWTLDPSEDVLENAKKILQGEKGITFVKGTTEELPFDDNFFDVVVSLVLLHHLKGLERGLGEMLRVLSKKGKLILIDWNPEAHILPFTSRHKKEDFFDAEIVHSALESFSALNLTMKKFQYWYIIEVTKSERGRTLRKSV